jgi:hypothetical protein
MVATDDARLEYRQFVELINTVRSKGLVTAEHRRDLDKRWRMEQENKNLVLKEIEEIMENYSRHILENRASAHL